MTEHLCGQAIPARKIQTKKSQTFPSGPPCGAITCCLLVVAGQASCAAVVACRVAQEGCVGRMWIMASCALDQWLTVKAAADTVVQWQVRLLLASTAGIDVINGRTAGNLGALSSIEVRINVGTGVATT